MTQQRYPKARAAVAKAAGLLAAAMLLSAAPAPAGEIPVSLGAVAAGKAGPEVGGQLRSLLKSELSSADFAGIKSGERYVLSANLVKLESVRSTERVRTTCVVSVVLTRHRGATLYALINGRGTAEDARAQADATQSDALRAAVHSAMVRVPKALR